MAQKLLLIMDRGGGPYLHVSVETVLMLHRYQCECLVLPSYTTAALCPLDQTPHSLMALRWGTFKRAWANMGKDLSVFEPLAKPVCCQPDLRSGSPDINVEGDQSAVRWAMLICLS